MDVARLAAIASAANQAIAQNDAAVNMIKQKIDSEQALVEVISEAADHLKSASSGHIVNIVV